jgi:hypothetical protein
MSQSKFRVDRVLEISPREELILQRMHGIRPNVNHSNRSSPERINIISLTGIQCII